MKNFILALSIAFSLFFTNQSSAMFLNFEDGVYGQQIHQNGITIKSFTGSNIEIKDNVISINSHQPGDEWPQWRFHGRETPFCLISFDDQTTDFGFWVGGIPWGNPILVTDQYSSDPHQWREIRNHSNDYYDASFHEVNFHDDLGLNSIYIRPSDYNGFKIKWFECDTNTHAVPEIPTGGNDAMRGSGDDYLYPTGRYFEMIEIKRKTNETDITIKYSETIGGKVKIDILGDGDFSHHLLEDLFILLDKLARQEKVGHQSEEWRK